MIYFSILKPSLTLPYTQRRFKWMCISLKQQPCLLKPHQQLNKKISKQGSHKNRRDQTHPRLIEVAVKNRSRLGTLPCCHRRCCHHHQHRHRRRRHRHHRRRQPKPKPKQPNLIAYIGNNGWLQQQTSTTTTATTVIIIIII